MDLLVNCEDYVVINKFKTERKEMRKKTVSQKYYIITYWLVTIPYL